MARLSFQVERTDAFSPARTALLSIGGKRLKTPAFMPVGTLATVKSLSLQDISDVGAECILGNAYHLHLRPGEDVVQRLGGLHEFMGGWPGLILTDSGGYQVFSLAKLRSIDEDGVTFQAHTDGSTHRFTPESVMEVQRKLGSDIMMVLDECPSASTPREETQRSAERTARWAERAKLALREGHGGTAFGICQGGMFPDLRRESAASITDIGFEGYAIGGLGIGEEKRLFHEMLEASVEALPVDRPRYLMGIGAPEDLVHAVTRGIDLFDCVLQTREARNGGFLTAEGRLNINNARFTEDPDPVDPECDCWVCGRHSRAYLHHLFRNRELLGYRLATIHNVRWTIGLMERMRQAIVEGRLTQCADEFLNSYQSANRPPQAG